MVEPDIDITDEQLDTLQELVNIGIGRAAGTLNQMIQSHIDLQVPTLSVLSLQGAQLQLAERFGGDRLACVQLGFNGAFSGLAQLAFPTDSASLLVSVLTGEKLDDPELDSLKIGTLSEVGNIVINGVMGSIGNLLHQHLTYALPVYVESTASELLDEPQQFATETAVLLARARLAAAKLRIAGDIILVFKVGSFTTLLSALEPA